MIECEKWEIFGWEEAIRGMRNPMNSWEKSDSEFIYEKSLRMITANIGPNDWALMKKLAKAGPDHRKFMRMITVYVDIIAPLYWWKEFDTYKVGTVANSCSTMHKLCEKKFELEDFSYEYLSRQTIDILEETIYVLNLLRVSYKSTNTDPSIDGTALSQECCDKIKKDIWYQMIQLLPTSYNQKRTVMLNYEVLSNIYKSRKNHKLDEWHDLCKWIENLPYSDLITGEEKR